MSRAARWSVGLPGCQPGCCRHPVQEMRRLSTDPHNKRMVFLSHDFRDGEVRVASFRNGVDNDVPLGNRTEELVFFNDGKQAEVVIPHLL
jgi:hypothetical protein